MSEYREVIYCPHVDREKPNTVQFLVEDKRGEKPIWLCLCPICQDVVFAGMVNKIVQRAMSNAIRNMGPIRIER